MNSPSPLVPLNHTCPHCQRPLIEIDHYSERLIGCIKCNRWGCHKAEDTSP